VKKKPASAKSAPSKPAKPASAKPQKLSPEEKAAAEALKLVDKAAGLLRTGIKSGAEQSLAARQRTRKEAHALLSKASSSLSGILGGTSSALHKAIDKTLGR